MATLPNARLVVSSTTKSTAVRNEERATQAPVTLDPFSLGRLGLPGLEAALSAGQITLKDACIGTRAR